MLDSIKIKLDWYSKRLLSEVYIRKVFLFSKYKKNAKLHQLPKKLVVSLTSYKPRFATLLPTILSLIQQKVAPNSIVLWVSSEDYKYIPDDILKLQGKVNDKGTTFEILKTTDIGPYTKIIPSIENFPDYFIVTADDDIYYPAWWLQFLLSEYRGNDREVICYLAHEITFNLIENTIKPYDDWVRNKPKDVDSSLGFPLGVGGVLYPPNCFDDLVTCHDVFLKESPMADDIWLFWMARIKGSITKKTKKHFKPICWPDSQKVGLLTNNVQNNANDQKIKNMLNAFGWPIGTNK
jgi:hypothetical protein